MLTAVVPCAYTGARVCCRYVSPGATDAFNFPDESILDGLALGHGGEHSHQALQALLSSSAADVNAPCSSLDEIVSAPAEGAHTNAERDAAVAVAPVGMCSDGGSGGRSGADDAADDAAGETDDDPLPAVARSGPGFWSRFTFDNQSQALLGVEDSQEFVGSQGDDKEAQGYRVVQGVGYASLLGDGVCPICKPSIVCIGKSKVVREMTSTPGAPAVITTGGGGCPAPGLRTSALEDSLDANELCGNDLSGNTGIRPVNLRRPLRLPMCMCKIADTPLTFLRAWLHPPHHGTTTLGANKDHTSQSILLTPVACVASVRTCGRPAAHCYSG